MKQIAPIGLNLPEGEISEQAMRMAKAAVSLQNGIVDMINAVAYTYKDDMKGFAKDKDLIFAAMLDQFGEDMKTLWVTAFGAFDGPLKLKVQKVKLLRKKIL